MKLFHRSGLIIILISMACSAGIAAVPQPEGQAADYYRILLKRPRPGYLFDRFFNSWLEQYDLKDLELFLKESDEEGTQVLLAFYYESVQAPEKASTLYTELIEANPDWKDLIYYKAAVDAERGFHLDAVDGLTELLTMDPGNDLQMKALKQLGRSQIQLGRKSEGLGSWEQLLEVSGMDMDVAEELLDLQLAEGLYTEALDNCDRLIKEMKDEFRKVQIRMRRAVILVRMDRRADAVAALREAYDLTGQGSWLRQDVLSRIELLFTGADDISGLCACYEDMLKETSEQPALLRAYAEALAANGEKQKALEAARKLMRLVPDNRELKEWYVQTLVKQELLDEAIVLVEQFLERYPKDNELRLQLAELYDLNDVSEKTLECIMAFLENSPKEEVNYLRTARQLVRYNFENEATSVLTEMISNWPDSALGREALAMHLSRKGSLKLALAWPHYEWLAKTADIEMLLRLTTTLQSVGHPQRAYDLLTSRAADYDDDARYMLAAFEFARALELKKEVLDYGMQCISLAPAARDIQMAASALLVELKAQEQVQVWVDQLQAEENPSTAQVWLLSSLLYSQGHTEEAAQYVVKAVEKNPEDMILLEYQFMQASRERNYEEAERVLLVLIELQPKARAVWMRKLIPVLQAAERSEDALAWIEKLKKASPHAIRPYELERDVLMASNRPDEAVIAMRKAIHQFDESKELKRALGSLYEITGRIQEADQLYWRMLNAEETLDARLDLLADIIRVNLSNRGIDPLIEKLERRAETSKTAVFPLLGLAECYRIRNRDEERKSVLAELLELRPNDVSVLRSKARMEEDFGNYEVAHTLMERIADLDATGAAFRSLMEYEFLYGDRDKAFASIDDPRLSSDPDQMLAMMKSLFTKGCIDPLIEPLTELCGLFPQDYRFAYLRALVLEADNQTPAAIESFLALWDVEEERPGYRKPTIPGRPGMSSRSFMMQQAETDARMAELLEYIPEELLSYNSLRQSAQQAYAYKQQNRYTGFRRPGLTGWMPTDKDQLKAFALVHLSQIGKDLSSDERDTIWQPVDEQLNYSKLLLIEQKNAMQTAGWWLEAEALYPESAALRIMRLMMAPHTIESEEQLREGIAMFADDHPDLARQILTASVSRFPDLLDLMEGYVDEMLEDDQQIAVVLQLIYASVRKHAEEEETVRPEIRELARRVGEACELREDLPPHMKQQAVVLALFIEKDCAGLVKVAQESFYGTNQNRLAYLPVQHQRIHFYSYSSSSLLTSTFPPQQLLKAQPQGIYMLDSLIGIDRADLEKEVRAVQDDPLFCLLASARFGLKDEELLPYVEALEKKTAKNPDELLTLASWYQTAQPEKSLNYLLELCEHREAQSHQLKVNVTLLYAATQCKSFSEDQTSRLKTLLPGMLSQSANDRVIRPLAAGLMIRFDMPTDALMASTASSSSATGSTRTARRRTSSSSRPLDPYSRFRKQIEEGRIELGLRQVASQLRRDAMTKIYIKQNQQRSQSRYQLLNCVNYIKQQGLQSLFLKQFISPEEGGSPRQWFEYGYACNFLSQHQDALSALRKVVEVRPEWRGVYVDLCMLLVHEDMDAARSCLEELPPDSINVVVQQIIQRLNENQRYTLEERLALCEMLVSSASDLSLQTFQNLSSGLQHNWYYNNQNLPSLFDASEAGILASDWKQPKDTSSHNLRYRQDEHLRKIQQQRRACYIQLLRNMAESGEGTGSGFSGLTAYLDFTKAPVDTDDLLQLALRNIKQSPINHFYYNYNQGRQGKSVSALQYYLVEQCRRNQLDELYVLMEDLPETGQNRKLIEQLLELHGADTEADYREKLQLLFDKNPQSGRTGIETAMALHALDERAYDIDDLVWGSVSNLCVLGRSQEASVLVSSMLKECKDADATAAMILRFVDTMLSDSEQAVLKNAPMGSISHMNLPALYNKYHQLSSAFYAIEIEAAVFTNLYDQLIVLDQAMQHGNLTGNLMNKLRNAPVDIGKLTDLGFVGDWAGFRVYPNSQQDSLLNQIMSNLNGDRGKTLVRELRRMDSQPFGAGLFITLLETSDYNKRPLAALTYLASRSEVQDASVEELNELFLWFQKLEQQRGSTLDVAEMAGAPVKQLFVRYQAWQQQNAAVQRESLSKVTISALMQDRYRWQNKWREVSRSLLQKNSEEAVEFYFEMDSRFKLAAYAQRGQAQEDQQTLQQIFQNPTCTAEERAAVTAIVKRLGSESAEKWYREQYVNQMHSRIAQKYQRTGMDYNQARLMGFKEVLSVALSSAEPAEPADLSLLKRTLNQLDSSQYPDLVQWLSKQDFPKTDVWRVTSFLFTPSEEEEAWLIGFLKEDENSLDLKIQYYEILAGSRGKKSKLLEQPDILWPLVEQIEEDRDRTVPQLMYTALLKDTIAMDAGELQTQRATQLFRLWDAGRTSASKTDQQILYQLVELAAKADREDKAISYLSADTLKRYPRSYAIALRHGYEIFVTRFLPDNITGMKNNYSASQIWIPEEAATRRDALTANIKSEELRQLCQLFLARLPVKTADKTEIDQAEVERVLAEVSAFMQRPEMLRWIVQNFYNFSSSPAFKKSYEAIVMRYAEQTDFIEVLGRNNNKEIEAYTTYIKDRAAQQDTERLAELLDRFDRKGSPQQARNSAQRKGLNALLQAAIDSGLPELNAQAIAVALKMERLRNPNGNTTPAEVLLDLGVVLFDPDQLGWASLSAVEQMEAYQRYDNKMRSYISKELKERQSKLKKEGVANAETAQQARRSLILEWLNAAGPEGFLPMYLSIQNGFQMNNWKAEQRTAFAAWLTSLEMDSLMMDQFKSVFAMVQLRQKVEDQWVPDLQHYAAREDLDVAERVRIFLEIKNQLLRKKELEPVVAGLLDVPGSLWPIADAMEQNSKGRLLRGAFSLLIEDVIAMEQGDEQIRRADQLILLWNKRRTDASSNDQTILYSLVEMAVLADMKEEAMEFLAASGLNRYPQTYAVALRFELDEFVVRNLPQAFQQMQNSYSASQCWIPSNAVMRCEAMADGFEDQEDRLMIQLFLARLPEKQGKKYVYDHARIEKLLSAAPDVVEQVETLRWLVNSFNTGKTQKVMRPINIRYGQDEVFAEVLKRRKQQEQEAYFDYVEWLDTEGNLVRINELIEQVENRIDRNMVRDDRQRKILYQLLRSAVSAAKPEEKERYIKIALNVEKARNTNPPRRRDEILLELGIMEYNISHLKLETLTPEKQQELLERYDQALGVAVQARLQKESSVLQQQGVPGKGAAVQVRIALIEEWVADAGADGFVPLFETLIKALSWKNGTAVQRAEIETYIQKLQVESIMVDQLKAACSLSGMSEAETAGTEERKADIRRYMNRQDLIDAEKIRFLVASKKLIEALDKAFLQERVEALLKSESLDQKDRKLILKTFPQPKAEEPVVSESVPEKTTAEVNQPDNLFGEPAALDYTPAFTLIFV